MSVMGGSEAAMAGRPGLWRQASVPSAIYRESTSSIPRYLTVLSSFVWPSSGWTVRTRFDPPVDQGGLGALQRVDAIHGRVEPDAKPAPSLPLACPATNDPFRG